MFRYLRIEFVLKLYVANAPFCCYQCNVYTHATFGLVVEYTFICSGVAMCNVYTHAKFGLVVEYTCYAQELPLFKHFDAFRL